MCRRMNVSKRKSSRFFKKKYYLLHYLYNLEKKTSIEKIEKNSKE